MITVDYVSARNKHTDITYAYQTRAVAERFIERGEYRARGTTPADWELIDGRSCVCCGARGDWEPVLGEKPHFRCQKHVGRNPCAIEGCKCTTADRGHPSSDDYLCGKHYRPLTTPRERKTLSMVRRKYKFAVQRGNGEEQLRTTVLYWKVLRRMVKLARRRSAGDIDMTEINKMFGWE